MASKGVNKVIVLGKLGQDPELRHSPQGTAFCNLSVATSESWNDKATGEKKEQTEWHRIVLNGKLAEIAAEYLRKGSDVYVEGKLRTRKWQDQSGQEKYTTEIVVGMDGKMQLLGGKGDAEPASAPRQPPRQLQPQAQKPAAQRPAPQSRTLPPDFNDDDPF